MLVTSACFGSTGKAHCGEVGVIRKLDEDPDPFIGASLHLPFGSNRLVSGPNNAFDYDA